MVKYSMDRTIWTFDLSRQGLDQVQDYIDRSRDPLLRIIHILTDDSAGFSSHWEDRYICLIQCDSRTATLLSLYE